ncbi:UNVERIFIED_ORG: hypothetical protein Xoosp15_97 [Xanthomonas phage Xoo-sp15]
MSIVLTERMAILKKMEYLEKERASLLVSYDSCLDRLRELDEIDRMSAEADHVAQVMKEAYAPESKTEPSKKRVVRVGTTRHKLSDEDLERISIRIGSMFAKHEGEPKIEEIVPPEVMERITEAEQKITDESIVSVKVDNTDTVTEVSVPVHKEGQTLQEYFEENKELLPNIEEPKVEVKEDKPKEDKPKEDKPKEEPNKSPVGEASSMLQMKPSFMRGTTNDNRIIAQFAKVILKDYGVPIKAKKLLSKLRDAGISMNSPYETLTQIKNYEPSIQKAGHGYYQYVPTR